MGDKRRVTAWVEDITDRAAEPTGGWGGDQNTFHASENDPKSCVSSLLIVFHYSKGLIKSTTL